MDADSLELLTLASAVGEALHIHESGIEDYLLARRTVGDWIAIARTSLGHFSRNLTFRTSGSTGTAKSCVHRLADLDQEVECLAALLGPCRRVLSAVPSHHIYGFIFTILLPHRLKVPVVDLRAKSSIGLRSAIQDGDLIVGHPEFWRAVARSNPSLREGVVGVTSTAPLALETAQRLAEIGLSRLVEIYGSSETAGIGWRDAASRDYTLFEFWKRGTDSQTLVRGPAGESDRSVTLQDRILWAGERKFRPDGRLDGAVQVGGINVFPARVEAVLATHLEIAAVSVRLMRADEGSRLKAFVVPRNPEADVGDLRTMLDDWATQHLSPAERPKSISFGRSLPLGPLGKPADWNIESSASVFRADDPRG